MTSTTISELHAAVDSLAARWRDERTDRLSRETLNRADFDALRDTGILLLPVPQEAGGLWDNLAATVRPTAEIFRTLATADPSVALVSAMHPAVVSHWSTNPDPNKAVWEQQRASVFREIRDGKQWGTITSEPGSGGDIAHTRAVARPLRGSSSALSGADYAVTGDKHFGSGLGILDRMMTTAIPDGETGPSIFVLDVEDRVLDGTEGIRLTAAWDGTGMRATQSHAVRLDGATATRIAWDGNLETLTRRVSGLSMVLFSAVTLGIIDEAVRTVGTGINNRRGVLRPYEQVEWAAAAQDHWLACQAYEGALRQLEVGDLDGARIDALRAKMAIAMLSERVMTRLCRVVGGSSFSRRSPLSQWFEDVRALGFLRPPWALAHDMLGDP